MDFSLFFFSNYDVDAGDKYRLLKECVRFADLAGLSAVWTPERHFHEFGGLFPNPAVINAALAMITKNVQLRSGSVVSPLHDVIRIAEEWSVVDNFSKGRVGLSFASGWNGNDFALRPENYTNRHQVMYDQIDQLLKLWNGEPIRRKNGMGADVDVRIFPSPIQKVLPIWITAAGNELTYRIAGEKGFNVLTHLLGQDKDELAAKIAVYRKARAANGFDASTGKVALMLHTYVGDSEHEIDGVVEKPFIEYLKSATSLSKFIYEEAGLNAEEIPEEEKELMLKMSYQRYSSTAALIGTTASCRSIVDNMRDIGVDEIACLVDFGVEEQMVLRGLENLRQLKESLAFASA